MSLPQIIHKDEEKDLEPTAFTPLPNSAKSLDKPMGGLAFLSLSHTLIFTGNVTPTYPMADIPNVNMKRSEIPGHPIKKHLVNNMNTT